ncbi:hypothetical protein Mro03_77040 [Microbispora rosea subsp. rosea]|nr:hypothetical protein Mro03_77040 [Microbispora rosea subsp. rosea]
MLDPIGHVLLHGGAASRGTTRDRGEVRQWKADVADHGAEACDAPPHTRRVVQPQGPEEASSGCSATNYGVGAEARQDLKHTYFHCRHAHVMSS